MSSAEETAREPAGGENDARRELVVLGEDIVARFREAERALEESKVHAEKKADELQRQTGKMLVNARERVPDFDAFLADHCVGLSRSRAYELISIAEGRSTPEAVRAKTNERKKRYRAAKAARRSATKTARPFHPAGNGRGEAEADTGAQESPAPAIRNNIPDDLVQLKYAFDLRFPRLDPAAQGDFVEYVITTANKNGLPMRFAGSRRAA
jgi:hypothetical protein